MPAGRQVLRGERAGHCGRERGQQARLGATRPGSGRATASRTTKRRLRGRRCRRGCRDRPDAAARPAARRQQDRRSGDASRHRSPASHDPQVRRRHPRSALVSAPDAPAITGRGRRPYRRRANTRRSVRASARCQSRRGPSRSGNSVRPQAGMRQGSWPAPGSQDPCRRQGGAHPADERKPQVNLCMACLSITRPCPARLGGGPSMVCATGIGAPGHGVAQRRIVVNRRGHPQRPHTPWSESLRKAQGSQHQPAR